MAFSTAAAEGVPTTAVAEGVPAQPSAPLFIDTNLDTHLAIIVSPSDTIANLKRKVCIEHLICFPSIGDITVLSMKVRRRATYYHLSDSMLIRTAFDGIKGTWFLRMDVAPINNNGNGSRGDANKTKLEVMNGLSSVDGLINADSSLKLTSQSHPDVLLLTCMSGGNQSSRLELPSSVLLVSETNCEALKDKSRLSGNMKFSGKSESSAPNIGNKSDVFDPESGGASFEGTGVFSSHIQLAPDIPTDKMNRDVEEKDCANLIDIVNDGDASIVAAEKENSIKRGLTLEDACLLKPSSYEKRRKEEEGKQNSDSWKDHDNDLLQLPETEDVLPKNMSRDHIIANVGVLGEVATELQKDDLGMPQELLGDKKKRKKKRRKESNERNTETDTSMHLKAIDNFENSTLETGLSDHASKENDLSLRKEANEDNKEESFPINDNYQKDDSIMPPDLLNDTKKRKKKRRKESNEGNQEEAFPMTDDYQNASSAMNVFNKKDAGDLTGGNHVDMDFDVPTKDNKRNARYSRRKMTKSELPISESNKSTTVHPLGKQVNEEKPEEVQADGPKHLATEPHMEIVPKEAFGPGNVVETLPETPDDVRSSGHSKKKSGKGESSKVRSGKDGAFSSAADIPEKAVIVSGNFTEVNSTVPLIKKSSSRRKKTSVQTKEFCEDTLCAEETPVVGPEVFTEQSLGDESAGAGNEIVAFDESLMSKTTQHGLLNTDHGDVTKESHKRKLQHGDTANSDLVDPPKGLATKHRNKSRKQKTAKTPQVMHQNDDGKGKSDMSHGDTSPNLRPLKSSQDNRLSENHDFFGGSESNKFTRRAATKSSIDYLGTSAHIGHQNSGGNRDNSVKEINAIPAASSDSTEEGTSYGEKHYRLVVRKVSKSTLKKDLNKPNQEEIHLNATDNISAHFTNSSSEDGYNEKDTKKNVSDSLTSDGSEENLEQTHFIRGPMAQMKTSSHGTSPSSAHLHEKEASNDDILLSQTSNSIKKQIALDVLLRGSQNYRKAKLSAQSQADDKESQPIDEVPETQPDAL